jgi:tetratricopeptide (TPR) repeat protein
VRGKALWCLVAAVVSLSGLQAQNRSERSYREIVEEFRANPDSAIGHVLDLPDDAIAGGIDDAVRRESVWPLQSRGAALLMHTDAALYLQQRDLSAAWVHLDRARVLADALARDPESAWLAYQWFVVVTVGFKDDGRLKPLVEHWHAEPWYAATVAMDRGLDLESRGSLIGPSSQARLAQMQKYDPDAFRQAAPFYKQAIAAHLEIAAVHLGRIEMLRGNLDEARRLFAQAADDSHWRTTRYLANLFLGSLEERDEDWGFAELRYRRAVDAIETAQSGRLALAAFLGRHGRGAEAAHALAGEPGVAAAFPAFDPWWSYLYPYSDRRISFKMILTELHVAVGR